MTGRSRTVALTLASTLVLAACAGSHSRRAYLSTPLAELRSLLSSRLAQSSDAWNRGNLDGYLASYADTAAFMSTAGPLQGLARVREYYRQRYFAEGGPDQVLRFEDLRVRPVGPDCAVQTGRYVLSGGGEPEQTGWFTLVWALTDEGWQIVHDHTS